MISYRKRDTVRDIVSRTQLTLFKVTATQYVPVHVKHCKMMYRKVAGKDNYHNSIVITHNNQ